MSRTHVSFYLNTRKGRVAYHRGVMAAALKKCKELQDIIRHPTAIKYHRPKPAA